jgi:DNA-directed RNA polymerase specialized sigma24 family protein
VDFDAFIRAHWTELVARFAWVSAHGIDPQDVVQQTLFLVYLRFASRTFATSDLLYGYCYVIGQNLVRSLLGPDAYARNEVVSDDLTQDALHPMAHDPEGIAIRNADLARVYDGLPETYRQVLVLAGDGFDHDLIAAALRLPSADAAKQLLYRARAMARRRLGPGPCVVIPAAWRFLRRAYDVDPGNAATPAVHGAVGLAAAVAFSLVTVVTGGAPAATATPRPPSRAAARSPQVAVADAGPGPLLSTAVTVGASAGSQVADPPRAPRTLAAVVDIPYACALGTCVGNPPGRRRAGTTLAVPPLGEHGAIRTDRVPVPCDAVPANPLLVCTEQEPAR